MVVGDRRFYFITILLFVSISAQAQNSCLEFWRQFTEVSSVKASPGKALIQRKIQDRTVGISSDASPVLFRDDGQPPTLLKDGIARLFTREILVGETVKTREAMNTLANKWRETFRKKIEADHKRSNDIRKREGGAITMDSDGVIQTPFLNQYRDIFLSDAQAHKINIRQMNMGQQEGWIKNHIPTKLFEESKKAYLKSYGDRIRALTEEIANDYNTGQRSEPDFARLRDSLRSEFLAFTAFLEKNFEITADLKTADLAALMKFELDGNYVARDTNGRWSIQLPLAQAVATYFPELGGVVVTSTKASGKSAFNISFYHGAGTPRSNVASWNQQIPLALQYGFIPFALDLPGSVGERGVGLNSVRSADEMAAYMIWYSQFISQLPTTKDLPVIDDGRSMGSLNIAIKVLMAKIHGISLPTQLFVMSSFSNPLTFDIQDKNIDEQLARGEIKGILKDAIAHANVIAHDFQAEIEAAQKVNPKIFEDLGDNMLFLQGEADEDGGPTVVEELVSYRDRFAPRGHVYIFEDPMKPYRAKGLLKGITPDFLEATHFLYSVRENVTNAARGSFPIEIPEQDLPKLRDQTMEAYALKYAMMDYLIDLSPKTSLKQRNELRVQRTTFVGADKKMGYLDWFIANVINPTVPSEARLTLDQIIENSSIQVGRRSGLYGRLKKVYEFVHTEAERIRSIR